MSRAVKGRSLYWAVALLVIVGICCGAVAAAQTQEIAETSAYLKAQSDQVLTQYLNGFMGPNPFEALFGSSSALVRSTLYKVWVTIAEAIAVAGLAQSILAITFADADALRQLSRVMGRYLVTGALIASAYTTQSWSINSLVTKTVAGSYTLGLNSFGGAFGAKLDEAKDSFTDMLGATVVVGTTVALPGAGGAMKAGTAALAKTFSAGGGRALAVRESTGAAATGLKAAGRRVVGFIMDKLGGMFTALQYFLGGYGTLISAAGWLSVLILVGAPLALALLNFGETRAIWTMFGTWIGVMLALMLMPLILIGAIDTALVQPSKSMAYYTQHLGLEAQRQQRLADRANQQTAAQMNALVDTCQNARQVDPANVDSNPCQQVVNQGALQQFGNWMTTVAFQKIADGVQGVLANIADTFVSFGVMVGRLIIGVLLASLLMFGVPVAAIGIFGGTAVRK